MDQNFQTSFIPKKPMVHERTSAPRSFGFFSVISIFILFVILLASAGLYFYKGIIEKNLVKMESDLNLAKNRFEPSKIAELQLLDKRLKSATDILAHHIAVTPVFQALSEITMKTVRYTSFSYSFGTDKNAKVLINMDGVAVGYNSIALQSDLFGTKDVGKNFIDPVFSNLALDTKGNVVFDLTFSVDPSFVDYKQMVLTEN